MVTIYLYINAFHYNMCWNYDKMKFTHSCKPKCMPTSLDDLVISGLGSNPILSHFSYMLKLVQLICLQFSITFSTLFLYKNQ